MSVQLHNRHEDFVLLDALAFGNADTLDDAIAARDYPIIQGGVLFVAFVFVVVNLLVDLSYSLIDPRIQYS